MYLERMKYKLKKDFTVKAKLGLSSLTQKLRLKTNCFTCLITATLGASK